MKKVIQKSIEGGYDIWEFIALEYDYLEEDIPGNLPYEDVLITDLPKRNLILLDPLFWQALGKAMGWEYNLNGATKLRIENNNPEERKKIAEEWGIKPDWRIYWHRFIDHLAEGKSADDFFNNLLAN